MLAFEAAQAAPSINLPPLIALPVWCSVVAIRPPIIPLTASKVPIEIDLLAALSLILARTPSLFQAAIKTLGFFQSKLSFFISSKTVVVYSIAAEAIPQLRRAPQDAPIAVPPGTGVAIPIAAVVPIVPGAFLTYVGRNEANDSANSSGIAAVLSNNNEPIASIMDLLSSLKKFVTALPCGICSSCSAAVINC